MDRPAPHPRIVLVAALDRAGAIGRAGGLLWHDGEDQRHFRRVTMGHPVLMGRKTWDSLPERFRPLPGRRNIVLSRNPQWQALGAERAGSLVEALRLAGDCAQVAVIGGAQLYAQALPQADALVLTEIDAAFAGADAHFPAFDRALYVEAAREAHRAADGTRYAFVTYHPRPSQP
jgi:dihydrofolate reductase